ncbi:MAG: hypothetical protein NW202_13600 [Nitrospira sp.]|nr:hypothetical protein [Nitrospira sp.]
MATGAQIVTEFVDALRELPGVIVTRSSLSRNVFELSSPRTFLLYVKGRAESPYRWGVTANVISRLRAQKRDWFVVLLYESKETGYLLSASDVTHYMSGVWPLGGDGDYKPAPGSYLDRNRPFKSFNSFSRAVDLVAD